MKEKEKAAQRASQPVEYIEESEFDPESLLKEFLLGKEAAKKPDYVPKTYQSNPQYQSLESLESIEVPREKLESYFDEKKAYSRKTQKNIEKDTIKENIFDPKDFDLRKAVLYNAILQRPYS